MKFCKVRDVKSPTRANPGDAGVDLFVPNDFPGVRLKHGESVLIPSGIKVDVPLGYALIFHNKSGVASKKNLDVMACVVDHGYKAEVHLNVVNNGQSDQIIEPGAKLVQGILQPIVLSPPIETPPEEMWQTTVGTRGHCGFGSTGD
jgi:dUTP pyrophosphatase